tara:strand:+ start:418 stop:669 length:252 start_codon:yes stop_codon:yes gene_type:complete
MLVVVAPKEWKIGVSVTNGPQVSLVVQILGKSVQSIAGVVRHDLGLVKDHDVNLYASLTRPLDNLVNSGIWILAYGSFQIGVG